MFQFIDALSLRSETRINGDQQLGSVSLQRCIFFLHIRLSHYLGLHECQWCHLTSSLVTIKVNRCQWHLFLQNKTCSRIRQGDRVRRESWRKFDRRPKVGLLGAITWLLQITVSAHGCHIILQQGMLLLLGKLCLLLYHSRINY